ncbi:MAG: BtpA/SgcQ family protein [Chloroflexi bacterium]|jgi:membrane complex biogenesis BtpA family protein|nr:BtpA/SgcQ family protein [Chloroflexota bacterium]
MSWFKEVFHKEKAIIASMYLPPLPGSPDYQPGTSLNQIIDYTRAELEALQEGGMDSVCIGNQQDWPYKVGVGPETPALMSAILTEAADGLTIPIGISIFWDDLAALAIAKACRAAFVRGVFRGSYAGEMGLMNLNAADSLRYRKLIDADDVKLMFMLRPIMAKSITERSLLAEVKDSVWGSKPDAFALCGPIPGEAPTMEELQLIVANGKGRPVIMNNGATPENIGEVLKVCDGAVVATHLRKDKKPSNPFDRDKVREFMDIVEKNR